MHSISMYDTGKKSGAYEYGRRNDGWAFASMFGGGVFLLIGVIMVLTGLIDPAAPMSVVIAGGFISVVPLVNFAMFATHHNFMLNSAGTLAMDAVYSLPKEVRDQFKITRAEANRISVRDAKALADEAARYLENTKGGDNGILRLTSSLSDFNETARMIESRS